MLNAIKPLAIMAMAALLSLFHQGCNPAQFPLDGPYAAETEKCALNAQSKAESQLCRVAVNWRYGLCPSEVVPC